MLQKVLSEGDVPSYRLEQISTGKRGKWALSIDGQTYQLPNSVAATAQVVLEADTPLSIKDIEAKSGYTNTSLSLDALRQIGILHSYQKGENARKSYHVAFPDSAPKDIPAEFSPYQRRPRHHFKSSVDFAPKPEVCVAPEHDPSPLLVDVPYIPLPPEASANILMRMKGSKETAPTNMSAVEFLKTRFEDGDRDGFQQAHDKDGNPGRWVFIGYRDEGPRDESESAEDEPKRFVTPDMYL